MENTIIENSFVLKFHCESFGIVCGSKLSNKKTIHYHTNTRKNTNQEESIIMKVLVKCIMVNKTFLKTTISLEHNKPWFT